MRKFEEGYLLVFCGVVCLIGVFPEISDREYRIAMILLGASAGGMLLGVWWLRKANEADGPSNPD